jgi:2,3-dihydroxyethylbenzene 1,2-dioxygenase
MYQNEMASVTELGYMGITVSDEYAWREFAAAVVGLEVREEGERDRFYLRADYQHHRIAVHVAEDDDLLYLGWRVAGRAAFEAMARQLDAAQIPFRIGSTAESEERHVLGVMKLVDPGGIPTEIFYAPEVDYRRPFHPGRPMHGRFSTGEGGLGHCFVRQPDSETAFGFYRMLGLTGGVEYKRHRPNGELSMTTFMHCQNNRQHSIGFGAGTHARRINHLMLEYTHLDDLGLAMDIARERDIPVPMRLGKHANDKALSFYMANPSGWMLELGVGGQPPSAQAEFYRSDYYGHQVVRTGYGF